MLAQSDCPNVHTRKKVTSCIPNSRSDLARSYGSVASASSALGHLPDCLHARNPPAKEPEQGKLRPFIGEVLMRVLLHRRGRMPLHLLMLAMVSPWYSVSLRTVDRHKDRSSPWRTWALRALPGHVPIMLAAYALGGVCAQRRDMPPPRGSCSRNRQQTFTWHR